MLVLKIELWPHGKEECKRELCRGVIYNMGTTPDNTTGDYKVKLFSHNNTLYGQGVLKHFPRGKKFLWKLVGQAVNLAIRGKDELQYL